MASHSTGEEPEAQGRGSAWSPTPAGGLFRVGCPEGGLARPTLLLVTVTRGMRNAHRKKRLLSPTPGPVSAQGPGSKDTGRRGYGAEQRDLRPPFSSRGCLSPCQGAEAALHGEPLGEPAWTASPPPPTSLLLLSQGGERIICFSCCPDLWATLFFIYLHKLRKVTSSLPEVRDSVNTSGSQVSRPAQGGRGDRRSPENGRWTQFSSGYGALCWDAPSRQERRLLCAGSQLGPSFTFQQQSWYEDISVFTKVGTEVWRDGVTYLPRHKQGLTSRSSDRQPAIFPSRWSFQLTIFFSSSLRKGPQSSPPMPVPKPQDGSITTQGL